MYFNKGDDILEFIKNKLIYIVLLIITVQIIFPVKALADYDGIKTINTHYTRARVTNIVSTVKINDTEKQQKVKLLILTGKHTGEYIALNNIVDTTKQNSIMLSKGDEVFISINEDSSGKIANAYIYQIARDKGLIYLTIFFCLSMIIIGGFKGLKSILTLLIIGFIMIKVFLNFILDGFDPIIVSVFVCIGITIISLIIVSGFNKKTFSAIVGTSCGVIISGVISYIMINMIKITGADSEEAHMLLYDVSLKHTINFRSLLFASILIGALGAVMDISMSIASAMSEIKSSNPQIRTGKLMKAGMSVGRDVIGTMANTLLLAYISGSICLVLGYMTTSSYFIDIINQDTIACEIVKTLAGSIGLIFTIPITVLICCFFDNK